MATKPKIVKRKSFNDYVDMIIEHPTALPVTFLLGVFFGWWVF